MPEPTLTAPFANTERFNGFEYVPAPEVIDRLNAVLGAGRWSFEVITAELFPPNIEPQFVVVKGRLSAWVSNVLGHYEQFGGQLIGRYGKNHANAGAIMDISDDYKGAASRALVKCAQMLGVGLYIALGHTPLAARKDSDTPSGNDKREEVAPPTSTSSTASIENPIGKIDGGGGPAQSTVERETGPQPSLDDVVGPRDALAVRIRALPDHLRALYMRDRNEHKPNKLPPLVEADDIELGILTQIVEHYERQAEDEAREKANA